MNEIKGKWISGEDGMIRSNRIWIFWKRLDNENQQEENPWKQIFGKTWIFGFI